MAWREHLIIYTLTYVNELNDMPRISEQQAVAVTPAAHPRCHACADLCKPEVCSP